MERFFFNNWLCIIYILLVTLTFGFFYRNSIIFEILLFVIIYTCMITIHELGHLFFGKLVKLKTGMFCTVFGIYANGKWSFSTTVLSFMGYTIMYKTRNTGDIQKGEYILYSLGGILFNLIAIFLLFLFIPMFPFKEYFIFSNIIIILFTCLPLDGSDMKAIIRSFKNWNKEKNEFENMSLKYDVSISPQECIQNLQYTQDTFLNSIIDLSKLEIMSMNNESDFDIQWSDFDNYNDKYLKNTVMLYYVLVYMDKKHSIDASNIEFLNNINYMGEPLAYYLKKYIKTKKRKYIKKIEKYKYQASGSKEYNILQNILYS